MVSLQKKQFSQTQRRQQNSFQTGISLFRHVAEWMKMDANRRPYDQRSLSKNGEENRDTLKSSTHRLPSGYYEHFFAKKPLVCQSSTRTPSAGVFKKDSTAMKKQTPDNS